MSDKKSVFFYVSFRDSTIKNFYGYFSICSICVLIYIIAHFVSQDSCIFSVLSYFSVDGDKTSITKRGASVKVFPRLDFVRQFIDASGITILLLP